MGRGIHICSFGSDLEDLKGKNRTDENVMEILGCNPNVSTWTISENYKWLWPIIKRLLREGRIKEVEREYPWHRYEVVATPAQSKPE